MTLARRTMAELDEQAGQSMPSVRAQAIGRIGAGHLAEGVGE